VCAERMDGCAEQKSTTWLFLLFEIAKSDVAARTRRVAFGANFRRNAFSLWTPWMGALFSCAHKETFSFRFASTFPSLIVITHASAHVHHSLHYQTLVPLVPLAPQTTRPGRSRVVLERATRPELL
jgi:hypothetical protein